MEDQGIAGALWRLNKMGRVDFQRVLFLRTGSNFTMPAPKQAAAESMVAEYAGELDALDALLALLALRVGAAHGDHRDADADADAGGALVTGAAEDAGAATEEADHPADRAAVLLLLDGDDDGHPDVLLTCVLGIRSCEQGVISGIRTGLG